MKIFLCSLVLVFSQSLWADSRVIPVQASKLILTDEDAKPLVDTLKSLDLLALNEYQSGVVSLGLVECLATYKSCQWTNLMSLDHSAGRISGEKAELLFEALKSLGLYQIQTYNGPIISLFNLSCEVGPGSSRCRIEYRDEAPNLGEF